VAKRRITKREMKEDKLVTGITRAYIYIQRHWQYFAVGAVAIIIAVIAVWGVSQANKRKAEDSYTLLGKALLDFKLGNFQASMDSLTYLTENFKGQKAAKLGYYYIGYLNFLTGANDVAIENFEKFLATGAGDDEMRLNAMEGIGVCLMEKGEAKEAAEKFVETMEKYPNSFKQAELLYYTAEAYKLSGDIEKAKEFYKKLIDGFGETDVGYDAKLAYQELITRGG